MESVINVTDKEIFDKLKSGMSPAQISIFYEQQGADVSFGYCRMLKMRLEAGLEEFADVEPLLLELNDEKWVHPLINNHYSPETGETHDLNVYRISWKNASGNTLHMCFKSNYLNEKCDAYFSQENWEALPKQTLFEPPFVDTDKVMTSIDVVLLDDVWVPHTEQFCVTKFGKKICKFFRNNAEVVMFSPDCGLTTDGTDWWCDT